MALPLRKSIGYYVTVIDQTFVRFVKLNTNEYKTISVASQSYQDFSFIGDLSGSDKDGGI